MKAKRADVVGKLVYIASLDRSLVALEYYEETCMVVVSPRYNNRDDRQGFKLGVEASIVTPAEEIEAPAKTPTVHPHRQTVIDRAANQGILKVTDADIDVSATLRAVAVDFVATYKGFNSFVQDLALALDKWGQLTIAQMRGAINVMLSEARAAKPAPGAFRINFAEVREPAHIDTAAPKLNNVQIAAGVLVLPVVPNGTYTIPINAKEYRVIRLSDCPESFNKPAGTQIAAYQSGKDNESDFTGFAFVSGDTSAMWRKFRNARDLQFALVKLITTGRQAEFGKLWAMASGRCFICGRKLTVPISKLAGIGPICAANTGIDINALAALNSADETRKARVTAQAAIDELFPD